MEAFRRVGMYGGYVPARNQRDSPFPFEVRKLDVNIVGVCFISVHCLPEAGHTHGGPCWLSGNEVRPTVVVWLCKNIPMGPGVVKQA